MSIDGNSTDFDDNTNAENSLIPTIFHQSWWLNAATNGNFDIITLEESGKIIGRLPYMIERLRGFRTYSGLPELTHFLGPGIDAGVGAICNRRLKYHSIMRALIGKLPKTGGFYQKMHAGITDLTAFQSLGFRVSIQYNFEIAPTNELLIWNNMRDKTRNVIRRAIGRYEAMDIEDPGEFALFYNANLSRQGKNAFYKDTTIVRVCSEAMTHKQGRIIGTRDEEGNLSAAIFYVWDNKSAYYLMSTRGENAKNGNISLLIWRAIQDCNHRKITFDFDGLSDEGSFLFLNGFGGSMVSRYIASRYSLSYRTSRRIFERDFNNTRPTFY